MANEVVLTDADTQWASQANNQQYRHGFRNPRGQKKHYCFAIDTDSPGNLELYESAGVTNWSLKSTIHASIGDTFVVDCAIFEDPTNSQLVVHLVYSANSSTGTAQLRYRRLRIADSDSSLTVGAVQVVDSGGSGDEATQATIAMVQGDYAVIAFTHSVTSKGKQYYDIALYGTTTSGTSIPDAPSWIGPTFVPGMAPSDTANSINQDKTLAHARVDGWPSGTNDGIVFAKSGDYNISGSSYRRSTNEFTFDGSSFTFDTHQPASSNGDAVNGCVDRAGTPKAHMITFTPGSTTEDVKHFTQTNSGSLTSAGTVIDTGTEQAITYGAMAVDSVSSPNKLRFYYNWTNNWKYKETPVDTISWGSVQTLIADTWNSEATYSAWPLAIESELHVFYRRQTNYVRYVTQTISTGVTATAQDTAAVASDAADGVVKATATASDAAQVATDSAQATVVVPITASASDAAAPATDSALGTVAADAVVADVTPPAADAAVALVAPWLDCVAYRFRNDDQNEANATWKANQNVDITLDVTAGDTPVRFRSEIENTGGAADGFQWNWEYQLNSGGWNTVTSFSSVFRTRDSSWLTDGEATTDQLTASAKTFVAGKIEEASGFTGTSNLAADRQTEFEISAQVMKADVDHGDLIDLRMLWGDAPLNVYTVSAQITIKKDNTATVQDTAAPATDAVVADNPMTASAADQAAVATDAATGTVEAGDITGTAADAAAPASDSALGTVAAQATVADAAAPALDSALGTVAAVATVTDQTAPAADAALGTVAAVATAQDTAAVAADAALADNPMTATAADAAAVATDAATGSVGDVSTATASDTAAVATDAVLADNPMTASAADLGAPASDAATAEVAATATAADQAAPATDAALASIEAAITATGADLAAPATDAALGTVAAVATVADTTAPADDSAAAEVAAQATATDLAAPATDTALGTVAAVATVADVAAPADDTAQGTVAAVAAVSDQTAPATDASVANVGDVSTAGVADLVAPASDAVLVSVPLTATASDTAAQAADAATVELAADATAADTAAPAADAAAAKNYTTASVQDTAAPAADSAVGVLKALGIVSDIVAPAQDGAVVFIPVFATASDLAPPASDAVIVPSNFVAGNTLTFAVEGRDTEFSSQTRGQRFEVAPRGTGFSAGRRGDDQ